MPHIVWWLHWNVNVTHSVLISIHLRQNIISAWHSLYVSRLIRAMIQMWISAMIQMWISASLTGATCRTADHSGAPEFTPCFSWVRVARSLVFCVVFWRSLFFILSFFFWALNCIVCSSSTYPFDILKLS